MREILFRGKQLDNGEWAKGYLYSSRIIGYISPCENYEEIVVDPSTVGQYTGLTDKNGVKIFEGDIVTIGDGSEPLYVAFIDFSWYLVSKRHKYYRHRPEAEETYTVIGNIYESPGLLEGVV